MSQLPKILLIDDEPVIAQLIGLLVTGFRGQQYQLDYVGNYPDGLAQLLTGAYAICLLDYRLGACNGLQLLREAKAQGCRTPVIMLTGDSRDETDVAAMESGASDFINKADLKAEEFERSIDYAIKTAEAINRLLARSRASAAPGPQP